MRGHPRHHTIGGGKPIAGERAIGAELAGQARQEPGRADVGKKADPDLRHGEHELVAGDAMRAVHRNADAAAHHDAVDQRHIRLAIAFDARVERVFLAEKAERIVIAPGAPEIVQRAQIAARRERARAVGGEDHARDRAIGLPFGELLRERAYHAAGHRIERVWSIERDETRRAAALEQDFRLVCACRSHPAAHR